LKIQEVFIVEIATNSSQKNLPFITL